MGQIALGLRSLVIKLAVFFLLAAALVWVLGGTLFPRAERVDFPAITFADAEWHVRLSVGGDRPGVARYQLMRRHARTSEPIGGDYAEASRLVRTPERLSIGMRRHDGDGGVWVLRQFAADGTETSVTLPDRLAVELALAAESEPTPDTSER